MLAATSYASEGRTHSCDQSHVRSGARRRCLRCGLGVRGPGGLASVIANSRCHGAVDRQPFFLAHARPFGRARSRGAGAASAPRGPARRRASGQATRSTSKAWVRGSFTRSTTSARSVISRCAWGSATCPSRRRATAVPGRRQASASIITGADHPQLSRRGIEDEHLRARHQAPPCLHIGEGASSILVPTRAPRRRAPRPSFSRTPSSDIATCRPGVGSSFAWGSHQSSRATAHRRLPWAVLVPRRVSSERDGRSAVTDSPAPWGP